MDVLKFVGMLTAWGKQQRLTLNLHELFMAWHKEKYGEIPPSTPDDVYEDALIEEYAREYPLDDDRGLSWDNPLILGEEEVYICYEGECSMCGRERNINDSGYCSQCWVNWNS